MNKLKILLISICCFIAAFCSEIQSCSEDETERSSRLVGYQQQLELHEKKDIFLNTIKIETDIGIGSGFIFDFSGDGSNPCLVTNSHVLYKERGANVGILKFHCTDGKSRPIKIDQNLTGKEFYQLFTYHPQGLDLCCLPLSPYIKFLNGSIVGNSVVYKTLNKSHLIFNKEPIHDIYMFGYPNGISDEVNNLPVIRKGITASNVLADFQGRSEILIDAACFPGSSGSPVFIFDEITPKILGILYGGPQFSAEGSLICDGDSMVCKPIPITSTITDIPMNLGIIIKSSNLLSFSPPVVHPLRSLSQSPEEVFLKGELIYKPNKESDRGLVRFPIKDLVKSLDVFEKSQNITFNLSQYGFDKYFDISIGYWNTRSPKGSIWIVPRFLIEKNLYTTATHFQRIMSKWNPEIFIGLFWRDKSSLRFGCNNKDEYRYLTNLSLNEISQNHLSYWKEKSDLNKSQHSYQVMDNGQRDMLLIVEKPNKRSMEEHFIHEQYIDNLMRCCSLHFF